MREDNRIIQGFWMGKLSVMEQLCMRSFLRHGHEFHLYTYYHIPEADIPAGVIVKDANEIEPEHRLADFSEIGGGFSDFFRFSLLAQRGGWWADMDMVCLKPLDFDQPYVYGGIHGVHIYKGRAGLLLNDCIIKAPMGAPIMFYCRDWYTCHDTKDLDWNTGPHLLQEAVADFDQREYIEPVPVFGTVPCFNLPALVDPTFLWNLDEAYALHLHHGFWNCGHESYGVRQMVDDAYPADCLYERLKKEYL